MSGEITVSMVEANGLQFEVLRCGEGEGNDLALCLHGFPEHALSWQRQLPVLAALGYRAWAPNQRGYGRSSRPPRIQDYAIEALMQDVAALIDAAHAGQSGNRRTSPGRTVLIGHDWGAVVAWCFATRRVRPLDRLVILNVPHPACYMRRLLGPQLLKSWYIAAFQIPGLPERLLTRPGAMERIFLRSASRPDAFPRNLIAACEEQAQQPGAMRAMLHWYRALVRGGMARQMRQSWPVIETPTLMIWGEADHALDKSTSDGTERYVRDLTLRYLPGISHWVQQDASEEVNALLTGFLRL